MSSAVPAETLLLDVTIDDAVATVDLSREFESGGGSLSMFARLAQVVYATTQFPCVDAVDFALEGEPVTVFSGEGIVLDGPVGREDYLDLLPTVFIDTPAAGAEVELPLRLTGMAAVFEATFQYRVTTADGTVLDEGFAMSHNGVGWGRSTSPSTSRWTHPPTRSCRCSSTQRRTARSRPSAIPRSDSCRDITTPGSP